MTTETLRKTTVYKISVKTSVPNDVLDLWGEILTTSPDAEEMTGRGFTNDGCYIQVRLRTDDEAAIWFARDVLKISGFRITTGVGIHAREVYFDDRAMRTRGVLMSILEERAKQERRYGHINNFLEDGTGPSVQWLECGDPYLPNRSAERIQRALRSEYERREARMAEESRTARASSVDWMRLVREEIAEAFQESDQERLEEELIQVAALCASWVERIRDRRDRK